MENSTKALLLAASVLIVIVLISVGIKILNSTSDVTNQVDSVSGTMATSVFNSQFLSYVSTNSSANQAKALISKAIAHNSNSTQKIRINLYHKINVNGGDDPTNLVRDGGHRINAAELQDLYSQIVDSSTYTIRPTVNCTATDVINGYTKEGYLHCLSIIKNN